MRLYIIADAGKCRHKPLVSKGLLRFLPGCARIARPLLRRILRRLCVGVCVALQGSVKVRVGHLEVMPGRNRGRIADPGRDHVQGMLPR